ncbi:hypothetical protein [Dyadobacter sp. LHD-138]|uniref:hypothetical protein n=1 Tax=Dyadobacter sp. LHD-138 TaxID=3071413 RepID=UPI0027E0C59A|nr:hypothetical protein [Dyadobacter sp. LHD-138]MDQ6478902.1 hypothetical protein [Dyadobacter sp. LHD-138]
MSKFFIIAFLGLFLSTTWVAAQEVPSEPQSDSTLTIPLKKKGQKSNEAVADTLSEKEAEEQLLKAAKANGDTVYAYKIITGDLSYLSVCPGTTITVPFATEGPFDADNNFIAHLIDPSGKSIPISLPTKGGPIKAVIPSYKIGGEVYKIQILSTIPVIKSQEVPIRLLQTPTARIEIIDGTQAVRVMPGHEVQLRVNLQGTAPWSFRLSDSTIVYQTLSNPHYLTVKPKHVQAYSIVGVSNACGSGTTSGEPIINVDDNPEPKLELKEVDKLVRVCSGIPFPVPFSATGKFKSGNRFVVQIADRTGAFKTISSPDTTGYITTQIPNTYKPGDYRLRVMSSAPYLISQTANISIVSPTVATLQRDSLHLPENGTGDLFVRFDGGGPWFVMLSDGTYENNIMDSPHKISVKPYNDTNYQISSAGGLCGVGKFSGRAKVSVTTPPASITMEKLPQSMVCAGSSIEIPYKTVGRYSSTNRFVVQITDKTGRFVDLPTTVTPTSFTAKVTAAVAPGDTVRAQKIRIISSSPAVSSKEEEIRVIANNKAVGEVSGKAFITGGRSTRITLKFKNGLPPWSFTLSDGTSVNGTFLNPYLITVSPTATTEYTISSLKSGCGTGIGTGSATVTVDK